MIGMIPPTRTLGSSAYVTEAADPRFHDVVDEHTKNGFFMGVERGTRGQWWSGVTVAVQCVALRNDRW